MRLFIAIQLTEEIRNALRVFLTELRMTAFKTKWVRPENLHVTLKFLGNTDAAKLHAIEKSLSEIRSNESVTLDFRGLGFFPNERRPRVFWIGMEASPNLALLAEVIDREMHKLGYALENRPFSPHLTLARFEPPGMPPQLSAAVKQNAARTFGCLTTREFHLIESKLKPTGAEYTTLKSFPFAAGT
jgi:RNA 2',3'-cyclic 3'-phosphodiesterase